MIKPRMIITCIININITLRLKMCALWFNAAFWNKLKILVIIVTSFTNTWAFKDNGCKYDDTK
jgi:hypothetical protein